MAWLGIGSLLLTWTAVAGVRGSRPDLLAIGAIAVLVLAMVMAGPMYGPHRLAVAIVVGALAGGALSIARFPHGLTRWGAFLAGGAALLFAVFGPADGLF